jgi:hypothetical protein
VAKKLDFWVQKNAPKAKNRYIKNQKTMDSVSSYVMLLPTFDDSSDTLGHKKKHLGQLDSLL